MSGPMSDGGQLTVKPELTIATASEVDFNSDYHIEIVNSDHSQLDALHASGKAFSNKRAIVGGLDVFKMTEGGFILPNGEFMEEYVTEEQFYQEETDNTALHELGHMLSLQHAFPDFINIDGTAAWDVIGHDYLKPPPGDVQDIWNQAKKGDETAKSQLSELSMNYPEGKRTVPEGAGKKPGASNFTPGQRTQIWNAAVQDQRSRLQQKQN